MILLWLFSRVYWLRLRKDCKYPVFDMLNGLKMWTAPWMEFTRGDRCSGHNTVGSKCEILLFHQLASVVGSLFFFFFCLLSSILMLFFSTHNLIWKIVYFRKHSIIFHTKILPKNSIKKKRKRKRRLNS